MRGHLRTVSTADELVALADGLASRRHRTVLGITGSPGAGKSTLGQHIVDSLGPERAVLVPMDGFHLANSVLAERGLRHVKGAIETFDDAGYASLLDRICSQGPNEVVYAPAFERTLEEPVAGSIPVRPSVPLVVTEGNYLLAGSGSWPKVRACLTECWFLEAEHGLRRKRLVARHMAFGKSQEDAISWAHGSDEANAALIESLSHRADRIIRLAEH
jgi:pantothenate kinase